MQTIQNRVRERRRQLDMTQAQVCAMVGISRWTLIRIERNDGHTPSADVMFALARALETNVESLFYEQVPA